MRRFVYTLITEQRPLLFKPLLLLLSFIYVNTLRAIKFFYKLNILKSKKLKSKVISVGNITWGGTGKTSLIALLCRFFEEKNKRHAVLIRGYGQDEDRMLKERLPQTLILSGRNRLKNALIAENNYNIDTLILDDGFQHWRIKRDLDIVTINAANPFGNRCVIPAGILREPLSALKRAEIIVITKVNLIDKKNISDIKNAICNIAPEAEIFEAEHQPVSLAETNKKKEHGLDYIAGRNVCAVAAVGDNDSFFKMLLDLSAQITSKFSFLDHHRYTEYDVENIVDTAKRTNSNAIITTQKDWVRLKTHFGKKDGCGIEILLLNIAIKIKNEEEFFRRISSLLNR